MKTYTLTNIITGKQQGRSRLTPQEKQAKNTGYATNGSPLRFR
jgi:hypothetical protein